MPKIDSIIEKIENRPYNTDVRFNELEKYYNHFGFFVIRTDSSHKIFANKTGKIAVVPTHNNKILPAYVKQAHDLIKKTEDKQ